MTESTGKNGGDEPASRDTAASRETAPSGESASSRETVPSRETAASRATASERAPVIGKEQEVLDVATEYFLKHGFEGTSINAMARRAGISKESIYRYFASKQELFEAVIDRELAAYQQRLQGIDAIMKGMDLREGLIALAEAILGAVTTDRNLALTRLVFVESARTPELGQHWYRIGPLQAKARLESMFAALPAASRSGFSTRKLSHYFIALVVHSMMLERECGVRPQPTSSEIGDAAETIVDDFMQAFFRGPAPGG